MDVMLIVVVVLAACGLFYFVPQLPRPAQIIVAIVVVVVCLLVLARLAGVPLHL